MEIKPIRSEAEYQAALREIEKLWEYQPGAPEGDRMDVPDTDSIPVRTASDEY